MATNFVAEGKTFDYANGSGSTIQGGSVVKMGGTLAVAIDDILDGESGPVGFGVFTVPKVSGAVIAQGESLTWDVSAGAFDDNAATPAAGDVTGPPAVAYAAAGDGDTTMQVLFTGVPGTVDAG